MQEEDLLLLVIQELKQRIAELEVLNAELSVRLRVALAQQKESEEETA